MYINGKGRKCHHLKIKFKQTLTFSDKSKLGVDENRHQEVDKAPCQTMQFLKNLLTNIY